MWAPETFWIEAKRKMAYRGENYPRVMNKITNHWSHQKQEDEREDV